MSDRQVKKYSARLYFLEYPALFGNRTSKNLGVLVRRSSEHFKIYFTPVRYFRSVIELQFEIFFCNKIQTRATLSGAAYARRIYFQLESAV